MLGAIIGDLVSSPYATKKVKTKDFPLYNADSALTDDAYLTLELARALLRHAPLAYDADSLKQLTEDIKASNEAVIYQRRKYVASYIYRLWGLIEPYYKRPYNEYSNGAAMRVSPVAWVANTLEEVKVLSRAVTKVTTSETEDLLGAEAVAVAIFLAKTGHTKATIETYITQHYYPRLKELNYLDLVKRYQFNVTASGTVPEAIYAFLISNSFSDALRTAISIGGDTVTITTITSAISAAYYPQETYIKLVNNLEYLFFEDIVGDTALNFYKTFGASKVNARDLDYEGIWELELKEQVNALATLYPELIKKLSEVEHE